MTVEEVYEIKYCLSSLAFAHSWIQTVRGNIHEKMISFCDLSKNKSFNRRLRN